ncbi:hypothetical protein CTI12_AA287660 [Artemisia annua]|uniref:Uncharacterized protein n=1 Tax=Artemisia annua TaxID=35608 RepID=A0A2U1NAM6_ARTAN|nr:hypothetical protein CTI12_AA287660 [Artemisia annua]
MDNHVGNGQRDDRRHINRERLSLQQLQAFLRELEGSEDSVLMSRTLAMLRAVIAIVEQRIRAYGRNVADAGRIAAFLMDYLCDACYAHGSMMEDVPVFAEVVSPDFVAIDFIVIMWF